MATVSGGLVPFNFTPRNATYSAAATSIFNTTFGAGAALGMNSVVVDVPDGTVLPPATVSTSLIITGGSDLIIPSSYTSVYDMYGENTVSGSGNLTVFLNAGPTLFAEDTGNDTIFAAGSDTIDAGTGNSVIVAGAGGATVAGAASKSLYFVGAAGAVSVVGGVGNSTLFGGTGGAFSVLYGGSGNNTLIGGAGGGATTLVGGHNATEFADGNGPTVMIAATGISIINGTTGTGQELVYTAGGTALIALNAAADTVVGGSGASSVLGGSGPDLFTFLHGSAGGSEVIGNFHAGDIIAFGGYNGNPVASESVVDGSDVIQLSDGTTITLFAYNHKVF